MNPNIKYMLQLKANSIFITINGVTTNRNENENEKEDGFRWWRLNSKEKYGKILNKIKKKYY